MLPMSMAALALPIGKACVVVIQCMQYICSKYTYPRCWWTRWRTTPTRITTIPSSSIWCSVVVSIATTTTTTETPTRSATFNLLW